MSALSLVDVCKTYKNGYCAVKNFNLEIRDNEFIIFVGPSGCGKSTTLRMIAGLEDISSGELWIDGQLMNMAEPRDRNLSMVFQNYALYPHMTNYENMAFGLRVRKVDKKEIDRRVREAARILQIEHLLDRKPGALSGGQKQRVAIGSVIVRNPKVFLMDEPLSNLDAKLRTQMRVELAKLHQKLKATVIYVTHDQVEAMTLGTRIVVMKDGEIQQSASPSELYQNPVNQFVAGFIGSPAMNFLPALVLKEEGGRGFVLKVGGEMLSLDQGQGWRLEQNGYIGKQVILGIRPEDFYPSAENADRNNAGSTEKSNNAEIRKFYQQENGLSMEIQVREMLGAEVLLHGAIAGEAVSVKAEPSCTSRAGESVWLAVDMSRIHIFDEETGRNIFYTQGE